MHDRNLAGWSAKAQNRYAQPDPERLAERDTVGVVDTLLFCKSQRRQLGTLTIAEDQANCASPTADPGTNDRVRRTSPSHGAAFRDRLGNSRRDQSRS